MNKKLIILVAAFVASFSVSADNATEGLVDSQGNVVHNNYGDCVEVDGGVGSCGETPAPAPTAETISLAAHALFDTAKSNIKPAGRKELNKIAASIKSLKSVNSITVTGHADSRGRDSYNQALSERRANSVKDYLVGQGVDSSAISATGLGESSPVASNKTASGRQQNRRVDLTISGAKATK